MPQLKKEKKDDILCVDGVDKKNFEKSCISHLY